MDVLSKVQADFLTCSMCYDVFQEPKTLYCLHRFCETCLHQYIMASYRNNQNERKGFPCPICRVFFEISSVKHPSEWTSLVKTDFYVNSLVSFVENGRREARVKQASELSHPCQSHTITECDLYCVDCSKIICHLCAGVSHRICNKVITLNEAASERKAILDVRLHDTIKKLDGATQLRSSLEICVNRFQLRKKDAETEVRKLSMKMHQLIRAEKRKLLEQIKTGFAVRQGEVSSKVNHFKMKLQQIDDSFKTLSSKVNTASDFDLMCDDSVLETLKEIEYNYLFMAKEYEEFAKKLSNFSISVQTKPEPKAPTAQIIFVNNELSNTSTTDSRTYFPQSFGHLKFPIPESETRSLDKGIDARSLSESNILPGKEVKTLPKRKHRLPSQEVYNSVSYSYINRQVLQKDSPTGTEKKVNRPKLSVALSREELNGPPCRRTEITAPFLHLKTIDSRVQEDARYCDLRDIIVMSPSNIIAVTDWANQSVKTFDTRREHQASLRLENEPWGITQMTEQLAAVALPLSRAIYIVEISSRIRGRDAFLTDKSYFGLAALNSYLLVASSVGESPCVDIINMKGKVLKTFTRDHTGVHVFAFPAYISLTTDGQILISDEGMGALICMSQNGVTKFIYKPEDRYQFHEARGVTVHSTGRILVAKSQGLLALTDSGQFENILVKPQKKVLVHPRGVTQDDSGLIYVTDKGHVLIFIYNTSTAQ